MMKNSTVTEDRNKYIGGSDVPIILGISSFKTRYELLLEKADIIDNDFIGNEYTEYGNLMEIKIRKYININLVYDEFVENCNIKDNFRYNSDGINNNSVLEIKTTSNLNIKNNVEDYKIYLAQLIFGMHINKRTHGVLAVYERTLNETLYDDGVETGKTGYNTDFNKKYLHYHNIILDDYNDYLDMILKEVDKFWKDLELIKDKYIFEGEVISESELIGNKDNQLILISNRIVNLEIELKQYKAIEKQQKDLKIELMDLMKLHNIKKWETPNGTKITRIIGKEDEIFKVVNFEKLEDENVDLCKKYIEDKVKKGKAGYIKITLGADE